MAPSNTNMGNAITYFDQMIAVPGALQHLEELSYHRYSGVSLANLQAIAARAVQHNLSTGMLEWWFDNGTYQVLHEDVTIGRNSAWQGSTLNGLFYVDASAPDNPIVSYRTNTMFNRQYFKFVRQGAARIDAGSGGGNFHPVAFVGRNGGHVVVMKADAGGEFTVMGLDSGTYGRKYTTGAEYDVDLPEVTIGDGETLNAAIPRAGVITVYSIGGGQPGPIPTVSEWGVTVMALLLTVGGTLILRPRRVRFERRPA